MYFYYWVLDKAYRIEGFISSRWRRFLWVFGIVTKRETWDLDVELSRWLAPRLEMMASLVQGHPADFPGGLEGYQSELQALVDALNGYVGSNTVDSAEDGFTQLESNLKIIQEKFPVLFPSMWT